MHRILWLAALMLGGIFLPLSVLAAGPSPATLSVQQKAQVLEPLSIVPSSGKVLTFHVEIAATPEEHAQGLMFRTAMPQDRGMLFVFGTEGVRSFWMRNTLIPLDILFIDPDGKIVKIHENAKPYDETLLSSEVPAFAALELNGGSASRSGIAVGDTVRHEIFDNVASE